MKKVICLFLAMILGSICFDANAAMSALVATAKNVGRRLDNGQGEGKVSVEFLMIIQPPAEVLMPPLVRTAQRANADIIAGRDVENIDPALLMKFPQTVSVFSTDTLTKLYVKAVENCLGDNWFQAIHNSADPFSLNMANLLARTDILKPKKGDTLLTLSTNNGPRSSAISGVFSKESVRAYILGENSLDTDNLDQVLDIISNFDFKNGKIKWDIPPEVIEFSIVFSNGVVWFLSVTTSLAFDSSVLSTIDGIIGPSGSNTSIFQQKVAETIMSAIKNNTLEIAQLPGTSGITDAYIENLTGNTFYNSIYNEIKPLLSGVDDTYIKKIAATICTLVFYIKTRENNRFVLNRLISDDAIIARTYYQCPSSAFNGSDVRCSKEFIHNKLYNMPVILSLIPQIGTVLSLGTLHMMMTVILMSMLGPGAMLMMDNSVKLY